MARRRPQPRMRSYFVDEAGDCTLFDRRGRVIIGQEGCSHFFILGVLDVACPEVLSYELEDLRARLLADPYFSGVPSMQPAARKTALAFHAKDDVPEVRREVYALLRRHELRFMAVVRDKYRVLDYVRERNHRDPTYRYNPNELYDSLVRRLFKNLLHKDDLCIRFSQRGKADRTAALRTALEAARDRYCNQWHISVSASATVEQCSPVKCAGLQAADYFLWALQRAYECCEIRYVEYLRPAFRLIHDVDDTREARYGVYYNEKRPLTLAALEGRRRP